MVAAWNQTDSCTCTFLQFSVRKQQRERNSQCWFGAVQYFLKKDLGPADSADSADSFAVTSDVLRVAFEYTSTSRLRTFRLLRKEEPFPMSCRGRGLTLN